MGKANKKGKGQGEIFDFARIDNLFLIASEKVDLPGHEFVSQENQDYFTFSEKSLYKIGNFFDVVGTKIYQWKRNAVLENEENRNACFMEAFAYCEYGKEPIVFKSITKGKIAREKSGSYGWSWDFIFIPDGYEKTMGNYPDEERCLVWNTDAYHELAEFLKNKED